MRGHLGEVYTEEVGVTVRAHLRGAGHISTASKAHIHLLTPEAREHTITHNNIMETALNEIVMQLG